MPGSISGGLPGPLAPDLVPAESAQHRRRRREHREHPDRPAQLVALRQREHQQEHPRAGHRGARQVEPGRRRLSGRGGQVTRAGQGGDADGDVDEEDHPPACPEQVEADQPAGDHRPEHRGQPHSGAEHRERLAHLVGGEQIPDEAEDLGQHDRRGGSLNSAGRDQLAGRGRGCARGRCHDERGHPGQQDALAAVAVAQPTAGQQRDGHRQRVGGGQPFDDGVGTAEVTADGRGGDLGDRGVEQIHHRGGDDGGERQPAARVRHGSLRFFRNELFRSRIAKLTLERKSLFR